MDKASSGGFSFFGSPVAASFWEYSYVYEEKKEGKGVKLKEFLYFYRIAIS
jgi:hypothetical protein